MTLKEVDCKAIIFDVDGLMIDSEPHWHIAQMAAFKKVNITLTHADCDSTTGIRIQEIVEMRYLQQPWDELALRLTRAQVTQLIVDNVVDSILSDGEAMPGLKHAINYFYERGYKLGVASSGHQILIEANMKRLSHFVNNIQHFECFVSAEPLRYGKPHPEVYQIAARTLNVDPIHCMAIEDSLNGTIAAKSARMKCISVPEKYPDFNPQFNVSDAVLRSLHDINDELMDRIWGPGNHKKHKIRKSQNDNNSHKNTQNASLNSKL